MARPTQKTIKKLFALCNNYCAQPGCHRRIINQNGTVDGEICHIRAASPGGPRYDPNQSDNERRAYDNLILLCRDHHAAIDMQPEIYTVDILEGMKHEHEKNVSRSERSTDLHSAKLLINLFVSNQGPIETQNIAVNSPGAVQAKVVNIRSGKKANIKPPDGTIGSDQDASRYVAHLIKRYNKFASAEPSRKSKFSHGAISRNIDSKFGATWKLLPLEKAEELYSYLQSRINRTRLARINKGKGYSSYSKFEEFTNKHR